MAGEAPLFADVADGPAGGRAVWLTAADGVRLRAALWTGPEVKGTILLFPGRTEYVEKYGRTAGEFLRRGYATVAIDWRGQGLADRLHADRGLGHVGRFADYQRDLAAVLDWLDGEDLPKARYLVAHSMGGCIGLRALHEGLGVKAAMFSAPMWGILMTPLVKPFAWTVSSVASRIGLGTRISPGQSTTSYLEEVLLEENLLTNDHEMFGWMQNQLKAHPELGLGGPSLSWLNAALTEMRNLRARPSPDIAALTFLGTDEAIVDPDAVRDRMRRWPNGTLEVIETGRHEMMMDAPEMRARVFDATAAHFASHA